MKLDVSPRPVSHFIESKPSEEPGIRHIWQHQLPSPSFFFFFFLCKAFTTSIPLLRFCVLQHIVPFHMRKHEEHTLPHSWTRFFTSFMFIASTKKLLSELRNKSNAAKVRKRAQTGRAQRNLPTRREQDLDFSFRKKRSCLLLLFFFSLNFSRMVLHRRSSVHCVQRASVSPQQKATGSRAP